MKNNRLTIEYLDRIKKLLITWLSIGDKLYQAYQLAKQKCIITDIKSKKVLIFFNKIFIRLVEWKKVNK
jgi:hypothetical protein